jgi:hypothetical protein
MHVKESANIEVGAEFEGYENQWRMFTAFKVFLLLGFSPTFPFDLQSARSENRSEGRKIALR